MSPEFTWQWSSVRCCVLITRCRSVCISSCITFWSWSRYDSRSEGTHSTLPWIHRVTMASLYPIWKWSENYYSNDSLHWQTDHRRTFSLTQVSEKNLRSFNSRSVRRQNSVWSKGSIFLIATFWPVGLCKAATTVPYAPSPIQCKTS